MSSCFPGQVNSIAKVEAWKSIDPTLRSDTVGCVGRWRSYRLLELLRLLPFEGGYKLLRSTPSVERTLMRPPAWKKPSLMFNLTQLLESLKKMLQQTWALTKGPVACKSLSGPTAELPQQEGILSTCKTDMNLFSGCALYHFSLEKYSSSLASLMALFGPWLTFVSFVPVTSHLKPYLLETWRKYEVHLCWLSLDGCH